MSKKKLRAKPELRLKTKSTASLDKSVADDLNVPDRPLTIEEIQKLNGRGSQAISWSSQNETPPASTTDEEMDSVDEEVD